MAEYIERDKAKELICNYGKGAISDGMKTLDPVDDIVCLYKSVDLIPSADVAPVVHGRWEYEPQTINTLSSLKCSNCEWWTLDPSVDGVYHYCPNCGAKMDLEG